MDKWHHAKFMINTYTPKGVKIPMSCIESAEFIIQTHYNKGLEWKANEERKPNVWMYFGCGTRFNISTQDLMEMNMEGVLNFDLESRPPQKGEGIAIFNVGKCVRHLKKYNMHFMAMLGCTDKNLYMSDINEEEYNGEGPPEKLLEKSDIAQLKKCVGMWERERLDYEKANGFDKNGKKIGDFRLALLTTSTSLKRKASELT
jgi:hypothetical protein